MFGIGTTELIIILLAALIILGPKKLPEIARTLGKGLAEFKRMSGDLQRTIDVESEREEAKHRRDEAKKKLDDAKSGNKRDEPEKAAAAASDSDAATADAAKNDNVETSGGEKDAGEPDYAEHDYTGDEPDAATPTAAEAANKADAASHKGETA